MIKELLREYGNKALFHMFLSGPVLEEERYMNFKGKLEEEESNFLGSGEAKFKEISCMVFSSTAHLLYARFSPYFQIYAVSSCRLSGSVILFPMRTDHYRILAVIPTQQANTRLHWNSNPSLLDFKGQGTGKVEGGFWDRVFHLWKHILTLVAVWMP